MSRPPSTATELKTAKRLLNDARRELQNVVSDRNAWRTRAGQLEVAVEDWKRRFDALLKVVPSHGDNDRG
jgi:FtsZ-binding cell division protein ZapB